MQKKVLLLFPKNKLDKIPPLYPPLGLGYISEQLSAAGISHQVMDMRLGHTHSELLNKINEYQPDFIGMTMMTFSYLENYAFLRTLKNLFPRTKIIVGGAHVSAIKERILAECDAIDYAVYQEGEDTLVELCNATDVSTVKGLFYRHPDTHAITFTGTRPINQNFDTLAFPKFEKFELNKYITDKIAILTSRGCPYQCTYCAVGTSIGNKFRPKSPQYVIQEIRYWINQGYHKFDFIDDNFTLIPDRAKEICGLIKNEGINNLMIECSSGIRADRTNRELLTIMRETGFYAVSIPVESASNKVLRAIKKDQDIAKIEETIRNACDLGFDVTLFFLVGSPTETVADANLSIALANKYPVYDACFHNLVPFPGTELFEWVKSNNYFLIPPDSYLNSASLSAKEPYFATPEFSKAERLRMIRIMRKNKINIQYKAYLHKYKKLGLIAPLFARLTSITSLQLFLARSKILRKIANTLLQQ